MKLNIRIEDAVDDKISEGWHPAKIKSVAIVKDKKDENVSKLMLVFEILSGKFLGEVVTEWLIVVSPDEGDRASGHKRATKIAVAIGKDIITEADFVGGKLEINVKHNGDYINVAGHRVYSIGGGKGGPSTASNTALGGRFANRNKSENTSQTVPIEDDIPY